MRLKCSQDVQKNKSLLIKEKCSQDEKENRSNWISKAEEEFSL